MNGLSSESRSLRLAFVFGAENGTVSESERWFDNEVEALAWLINAEESKP